MSENVIRVKSWLDLQDCLYADSWQADIKRHRVTRVYRGVPTASDNLSTSLMRLGGNYAELEPHLLRNFRKYAHHNVVEQDTVWHWLTLAQHHNLPTRLLDWTVSPYVAAHFATVDVTDNPNDSAIWVVDHTKVNDIVPEQLKRALDQEGADYFTLDILAQLVADLTSFDALAPPMFALFFEPPSLDERIVNQFALFSVMPDPTAGFDQWLYEHLDFWHKIVIPADLKWEVRDKLDQANITERVLFPGLDGLSSWLKRYYTPRL